MFDDDTIVNPMNLVLLHDDLETLKKCLPKLSWYEQELLDLRFGLSGDEPKTLDECSKIFRKTKERIRQQQKNAITRLKELMLNDGIEPEEAFEN